MNRNYENLPEDTVLAEAVHTGAYIVAQGTNGMTYTGRALAYNPDEKILTVIYEKEDKELRTDLFISTLCSLQMTTKEEIERVRKQKQDKKRK